METIALTRKTMQMNPLKKLNLLRVKMLKSLLIRRLRKLPTRARPQPSNLKQRQIMIKISLKKIRNRLMKIDS